MAASSAVPQSLPVSFSNHNCSRLFSPSGLPSVSRLRTNRPKASFVAFNGAPSLFARSDASKSVRTAGVVGLDTGFLQMGSRETCSNREVLVKSSGAESSSTSSVFKIVHLIVSLGLILAMDKFLKKAFVAAAIKFPSALFGMFCIFSVLVILDTTVPAAAKSVESFFEPALLFIQRWLPLFYVPSLVVLPLSVKDIPAASGIKISLITVGGWLATLCVAGFTAIAVRKLVKTEMVDAEPMAKPSPFSPIEIWSWSGILLVSFVSALLYPTALGTGARTCLPFLLASTVLGYIVGSGLPSAVKKVFHPIICCALSADLTALAFGYLSRSGLDPVLGFYLTKASSNPGAGDVLMGFLGSVILSFAFSMFKQRKLVKRHAAEIFTSVIVSTVFSLYSTALVGRLVGLEPGLTVSILPRCITVALALSIVSLFEGMTNLFVSAVRGLKLRHLGVGQFDTWASVLSRKGRKRRTELYNNPLLMHSNATGVSDGGKGKKHEDFDWSSCHRRKRIMEDT
ncbi:CidB/LrgB family [Trema orientale]|uniref:CidB/LrgB family n=1 Tax=Trema orientale TaxID=63057 RepID=A0A2P5FAC0_TREOI|nr:CidB/LrgB family [Trema orientale]